MQVHPVNHALFPLFIKTHSFTSSLPSHGYSDCWSGYRLFCYPCLISCFASTVCTSFDFDSTVVILYFYSTFIFIKGICMLHMYPASAGVCDFVWFYFKLVVCILKRTIYHPTNLNSDSLWHFVFYKCIVISPSWISLSTRIQCVWLYNNFPQDGWRWIAPNVHSNEQKNVCRTQNLCFAVII